MEVAIELKEFWLSCEREFNVSRFCGNNLNSSGVGKSGKGCDLAYKFE
jgi:hypothetical protein